MRYNINKKVQKELLRIEAELDQAFGKLFYSFNDTVDISGEDLILSGQEEINGKPVDPEETYKMTYPASRNVNFYKVMKRIYKREGFPGILDYIESLKQKFGFDIDEETQSH